MPKPDKAQRSRRKIKCVQCGIDCDRHFDRYYSMLINRYDNVTWQFDFCTSLCLDRYVHDQRLAGRL